MGLLTGLLPLQMFHWIYPVTPPGASKTNECNSITARIPVNGVRNRCFSCVYLEGTTTCAHTFLNQQVYNFMQKKTAVRTARKANVEEFVPLCYWGCNAVSTFPNKDVPVHPVVQDVALLRRQHGLFEGTGRSHGGHLHRARCIRDLRSKVNSSVRMYFFNV